MKHSYIRWWRVLDIPVGRRFPARFCTLWGSPGGRTKGSGALLGSGPLKTLDCLKHSLFYSPQAELHTRCVGAEKSTNWKSTNHRSELRNPQSYRTCSAYMHAHVTCCPALTQWIKLPLFISWDTNTTPTEHHCIFPIRGEIFSKNVSVKDTKCSIWLLW